MRSSPIIVHPALRALLLLAAVGALGCSPTIQSAHDRGAGKEDELTPSDPSMPAPMGGALKHATLATYAWSFDVSSYGISVSHCRHNGIGSRLEMRDAVDVAYREEAVNGRIYLTEVKRTPLGNQGSPSVIKRWYNHGRTVNYEAGCQDSLGEVSLAQTLKPYITTAGESVIEGAALAAQVTACIGAIPDGPCDQGGSCKYCLPSNDFDLVQCSTGGESWGGHNSNSDAQMIRILWDRCTALDGNPPSAPSFEEVCGNGVDGENLAACNSVLDFSESTREQSEACSTPLSLYGTSNASGCTGQQPTCGNDNRPVCGLG